MASMKRAAALLVALLVLAGCSGKDKDGEPTPTATASSTSASGSAAPGTIEVALNRTTPDGGVPLVVNFTLDATFRASNGTEAPRPSAASWSVTILAEPVGNATGTATDDDAQGPTGSALPANVTLTLNETGSFTIVATVDAPGFAPGNDSFIVAVFAGGAGGAPLFFDGGETDDSQWTLQSRIYFNPNLQGSTGAREIPEDHDAGPWAITDAEARTGTHAWLHPYPDNYRTRMTSVPIAVPAGGAALSYALRGGAEETGVEGLFVLVGLEGEALEVVAEHRGAIAEWTLFEADLPEGSVQVEFRFDSDLSCSNDSGPPPGFSCGDAFDAGGFRLDDITVA